MLDFGGTRGREALRGKLNSKDYDLWSELDQIMALGCALSGDGALSLPWYFNQDMGNFDAYDGHLVTGSRVALRAGPSLKSRVLTRLSWIPVEADWSSPQKPEVFLRVKTAAGQIGYVHLDYLRSFIDYRMRVEQRDGKWRIAVFIAGD